MVANTAGVIGGSVGVIILKRKKKIFFVFLL